MPEEHESDIPEWEIPDESIPPSLNKKWQDDEKRGIRAGLCPQCQWPFTEEELSCRHCGHKLEVSSGLISDVAYVMIKTPFGIITILILILAFLNLFL